MEITVTAAIPGCWPCVAPAVWLRCPSCLLHRDPVPHRPDIEDPSTATAMLSDGPCRFLTCRAVRGGQGCYGMEGRSRGLPTAPTPRFYAKANLPLHLLDQGARVRPRWMLLLRSFGTGALCGCLLEPWTLRRGRVLMIESTTSRLYENVL